MSSEQDAIAPLRKCLNLDATNLIIFILKNGAKIFKNHNFFVLFSFSGKTIPPSYKNSPQKKNVSRGI
jgi:hypothetical protein